MKKLLIMLTIIAAAIAIPALGNEQQQKRCILTLELKQVHYSLDVWKHAKDAMNATTFDIPVDREFYNSVHVGDRLSDKFRTGSLILRGSFGKWKVTVKGKREE